MDEGDREEDRMTRKWIFKYTFNEFISRWDYTWAMKEDTPLNHESRDFFALSLMLKNFF